MNEIEKEYEDLLKKYKLPIFKKLNQEFELTLLKDIPKEFTLRAIRRKITERVVLFCRILEGLIHPINQSIIAIVETKSLADEEKEDINKLLKSLMYFERESLTLDINFNDEDEVNFINAINNAWPKFKAKMKEITEKMRDSWKTEEKSDVENYFG